MEWVNEFGIALAIRHAPKGKPVMVGGKLFAPGEFIPDDVWSKLTEAEKKFDKRLASLAPSKEPAKETPSAVKKTPPTTELKKPSELTDRDRKAALTKLAKLPTLGGRISPPLEIKREKDTIGTMKEIVSKGKFEDGWLDPSKITATQDEVEADHVKKMINSIGRVGFEGLNKPIIAVKLSDGRIYIDEGHHRTTASVLLGCKVLVRLYTIPSQDTALSLWAEEITRDCFLSANGDNDAALLAAQIIVATQPFSDEEYLGIYLAHDIHNRQAQGILNRSIVAAKGMSAAARKDLDAALKKASTGSGEAILNFIDKYRVQLAKILTQTQIASILSGARAVADKIPTLTDFPGAIPPPPTLEPHEAVKLIERLEELTPDMRAEEVYKLRAAEQVYVNQAIAARAAPPVVPPTIPVRNGDPDDVHLVAIDEAVRNLAGRNVMDRQKYDALEAAARAKSFTVANVAAEETLTKIRDSLAENVKEGADYETWRKKVMEDVGQGTFMSDAHQETLFRTNVQTGFADGQESILSNPLVRSGFPYRARDAIHDDRARHNHLALEKLGIQGTNIYRADDPVWQMFRAPWDYNDRCSDTAMTVRQAAEKGIKEAQTWLETGAEPADKAWVNMPDFRPPPGFQRAVVSAPMSIQLSMQSIATFSTDATGHQHKGKGEGGGQFTKNSDDDRDFKSVGIINTSGGGVHVYYDKQVVSEEIAAKVYEWIKKIPQSELSKSVAKRVEIFENPEDMFQRMSEVGIDPEIEQSGEVRGAFDFDSGTLYASTWNGEEHSPHTLYHEFGHSITGMDEDRAESWAQSHLDDKYLSIDAAGHQHKGTGSGGGQFTKGGGGDSGGIPSSGKQSKLKSGITKIKSVASKVGGRMSQLINRVPVVGRIKRGMAAAIGAINTRNEKKYGPAKAKAIMWGGAVVGGYGIAFGAGALVGIPGVPVLNDLLGILAATAVADVGSLVKKSVGLSADEFDLKRESRRFHAVFSKYVKVLVAKHKDDLIGAFREDGGAAKIAAKMVGEAKSSAALSITLAVESERAQLTAGILRSLLP